MLAYRDLFFEIWAHLPCRIAEDSCEVSGSSAEFLRCGWESPVASWRCHYAGLLHRGVHRILVAMGRVLDQAMLLHQAGLQSPSGHAESQARLRYAEWLSRYHRSEHFQSLLLLSFLIRSVDVAAEALHDGTLFRATSWRCLVPAWCRVLGPAPAPALVPVRGTLISSFT